MAYKKKTTRTKRKQSNLSKILSSSRTSYEARIKFFEELSPIEIHQGVHNIANNLFFKNAIRLTKDIPITSFFEKKTPNASLEKNIAWCLALVEVNKLSIISFIELEKK
ncbi:MULTISPECIES: hypothetical protein [Halomonas]|uniref:hypothetical protein n=1 Tax=Halomonas TaxID=2745 RepID=UPI0018681B6B|nr:MULTISPECIES: hypothetical protein [Halomonas]